MSHSPHRQQHVPNPGLSPVGCARGRSPLSKGGLPFPGGGGTPRASDPAGRDTAMHPPAGAGAQPSLTAGPAGSGTGQTEGPHPPSGKDVTEHDGSPGAPGAHAHDRRQRRENGGDHHQHGQPGSPRPCLSTNYCVDLQARLHGCGGRGWRPARRVSAPSPLDPSPRARPAVTVGKAARFPHDLPQRVGVPNRGGPYLLRPPPPRPPPWTARPGASSCASSSAPRCGRPARRTGTCRASCSCAWPCAG